MKVVLGAFAVVQAVMAVLFAAVSLALTLIAAGLAWRAVAAGLDMNAAQRVIEALGLLTTAVVALQISQTIMEEEVIRAADVSGPTRVRRFLSRFLVVLVVALVIEGLVAIFKALQEDISQLLYAALVIGASGVLLAAWGLFLHLNRSAEELEPEAMAEAKREDRKLQ